MVVEIFPKVSQFLTRILKGAGGRMSSFMEHICSRVRQGVGRVNLIVLSGLPMCLIFDC